MTRRSITVTRKEYIESLLSRIQELEEKGYRDRGRRSDAIWLAITAMDRSKARLLRAE